ncbi:MAG: helicase-associated domain-containing protein [Spirochaetaceae bacterium]|jgi:hypothetical protein|nr:helicase-associated domain-containing protein [Spirochaetaceae bacterium]
MGRPFRSPDEWRADLLSLPDSAYFDLMRTVFGAIKTPFNKHRLMEDLSSFLIKTEVQETIGRFIDEQDHRIIAAVAVLENPTPGELELFFAGEYGGVELQGLLFNLEERMILSRFRDDGVYRLALNPLLEPVLAPFAADPSPLFPAAALSGEAGPPALDDRTLAAFISFALSQGEFFRGDGIRKRTLEDAARLFPGMDPERFTAGLIRAEILRVEGAGLGPAKLDRFGLLSPLERREYVAAGIYESLSETEGESPYFRGSRLRLRARFIHRFIAALSPGKVYSRAVLIRLLRLVRPGERDAETPLDDAAPEPFFRALCDAALLLPSEDGYALPGEGGSPPNGNAFAIALDTPFSLILFPGISWEDALNLALFCEPRETGAVVRFEITRDSAVRGFDRGLRAQELLSRLERLSGFPADQNLRWTLTDWGERYDGVSLQRGTVLTLSEDRRYLAETGALSTLIGRTLAPGVYLLLEDNPEAALEVLEKSGVDIVARPGLNRDGVPEPAYPPLASAAPALSLPASAGSASAGSAVPAAGAEEEKSRFRRVLEARRFPAPVREDLRARIERRLIVSENQLLDAPLKQEKLEARNLDYTGKIAIAKQALARKSLVEAALPDPASGGERRIFGVLSGLEKNGGETILVLRPAPPAGEGEAEPVRIPLGKISLLRRIRQSIFEE